MNRIRRATRLTTWLTTFTLLLGSVVACSGPEGRDPSGAVPQLVATATATGAVAAVTASIARPTLSATADSTAPTATATSEPTKTVIPTPTSQPTDAATET